MGSLFPRRAESQSESHLNRASCTKALVQTVQGVVAQLPVAPNVERLHGRDQLRNWVVAASAVLCVAAALAGNGKALP